MSTKSARILTIILFMAVAACGSTSKPASSASPEPSSASPATTSATATAGSSSSAATSPTQSTTAPSQALSACATSALKVTLGSRTGAAGTFYQAVNFENVGPTACTLVGYPGVSFTDGSGHQIGMPADRANLAGRSSTTVVLQPQAFANAAVALPNTDNFPKADCDPAGYVTMRVYPPNQTVPVSVSLLGEVCTTADGGTEVSPVASGKG